MNQEFFNEQTEQSQIKAKIVTSYFAAWSRVIRDHWPNAIGYIDLYSGPGVYQDGTPSVPIMMVKQILGDPSLSARMLLAFNDADEGNIDSLRHEIEKFEGATALLQRTSFSAEIVDSKFYDNIRVNERIPVLSFVDPFGYKGLTMQLINKLIQNNGSDCIFFFNYNRINMALSTNPNFDDHLTGIFGEERMKALKRDLADLNATHREQVILDSLLEALRENKANYILPFKFYCSEMKRTSHYIIFVTKHPTGFKIMKDIMYKYSARDVDDVATFDFKDRYNFGRENDQLTIFSRPLDDLCETLLVKHCGKTVQVGDIVRDIYLDPTSRFVATNVKEALKRLECKGNVKITDRKIQSRAGKITMPDKSYATFRERE